MDFVLLNDVIPQWAWWLISFAAVFGILACVVTAVIFFVKSAFDDFKNQRKIIGFSFLALAVVIGVGVAVTVNTQKHQNNENMVRSTENLKSKYELNGVEWHADETTARPDHTEAHGNLVVIGNDNQRIVFKYKVNMETGEPFLENMPVQGGSVPRIKVENLLKQ